MKKTKDYEFFKPEDFQFSNVTGDAALLIAKSSAEKANEKLAELIESWPVVYTTKVLKYTEFEKQKWSHISDFDDNRHPMNWATHTARIAFIQEIKKECPGHEPTFVVGSAHISTRCKHCGVELETTWSEVKK